MNMVQFCNTGRGIGGVDLFNRVGRCGCGQLHLNCCCRKRYWTNNGLGHELSITGQKSSRHRLCPPKYFMIKIKILRYDLPCPPPPPSTHVSPPTLVHCFVLASSPPPFNISIAALRSSNNSASLAFIFSWPNPLTVNPVFTDQSPSLHSQGREYIKSFAMP